jgi:hypothetical protein
MMMEDAKFCNNNIYIMYADFKGAFFNATDHRNILRHTRQFIGMPPTFVDTCEQYTMSPSPTTTPSTAHPHTST